MNSQRILFAAGNDVWNVLVPILTIVFFAVVSAFRHLTESAAAAPKKTPRPPGTPQAPRRPSGPKDLEKILEELGLRRPESESKPPAPSPAATQPRKAVRKSTQANRSSPAPEKENLRRRHLHSEIEQRHAAQIQSRVERQHLATLGAGLTAADLAAAEASKQPTTTSNETAPLFATPADVTRAFMIQTILGPPVGLQED